MITGKNIVLTGASSGIGLETLKLLMGVRPVNDLYIKLKALLPNVVCAGDAVRSGRIADAVHSGFDAAMSIR